MNPLDWASVSESPHKSSRVSDWKVTAANMTHSTFHSIALSSSLVILSSFTPSLPAFLLTLCSCSFPVALPWPLLCLLFLGLLLPLRFSACFSPAHLALFCILSLSATTLLPSSMHHSYPLLFFYLFRISVFSSYCYLLHSFLFLHSSPLSRSLSLWEPCFPSSCLLSFALFFLLYGGWWIRDSSYSRYRRCSSRQQGEREREVESEVW